MTKLKVSLKSDAKIAGNKRYFNEVNADNFKDVALVLKDLETCGVPIKKAIKQYNIDYSDWNAALGLN